MGFRFTGLIAATYTPLSPDGSLDLDAVPAVADGLIADGVDGFYVCGSTGEGVSLTTAERMAVAEAYIAAAGGRVPVAVQVGHNALRDAADLAAHAAASGAALTSAAAPSYFKVTSAATLVDCMAEIAAAAPDTPFYYYHIPSMTGAAIDMVEFLTLGAERIPNLAGIKFTSPALHEVQACMGVDGGRFDLLWGVDEMLMAAWSAGVRGAIGSTFNVAAPLYRGVIAAVDAGDLAEAARLQTLAVSFIRELQRFPFHPAMKALMALLGRPVGPCRLPQPKLADGDAEAVERRLRAIGFFDFARGAHTSPT